MVSVWEKRNLTVAGIVNGIFTVITGIYQILAKVEIPIPMV
jgi:hypothetical protein